MNPATVILAAMLVAAGCTNGSATSNPVFSNISKGAIGWSAEGDGEVTPGVDDAQILCLDDFVVFWSDFPSATATSIAYGSDGDHLGGGGQFIHADIGEIDFRYEIADRSSGTVVIGSETFEFSGGGLFLIAARKVPASSCVSSL